MTYTLRSDGGVTRDADGAIIPPDPNNGDWQAYQSWLAVPNTPNPVPTVPPPPPIVTGNQWAFAVKTCKVASQ